MTLEDLAGLIGGSLHEEECGGEQVLSILDSKDEVCKIIHEDDNGSEILAFAHGATKEEARRFLTEFLPKSSKLKFNPTSVQGVYTGTLLIRSDLQ